ncbi:hypothetical protein COP2_028525 [Malus domestica]
MWYNYVSEYLTSQGYVNNELCPCVFIKKSLSGFAIVVVHVEDMNLIETPEELARIAAHLKSEFEMKYLGKTQLSWSRDRAPFGWNLSTSIELHLEGVAPL